jgi:hypothetical protein
MELKQWYVARGPKFIYSRAAKLLGRYGMASSAAVQRIESCVATLDGLSCPATFAVPAVIVERYPRFIRHLQDSGVEIAVHGYQHIDLNALPIARASDQLVKAAEAFRRMGIEVRGFRCPYIGCRDELLDALPSGLFDYSSNKATCYEEILGLNGCKRSVEFDVLHRFYSARAGSMTVSMPWMRSEMLEIPVCVPDDIQLHDGMNLGAEGLSQAWRQMLRLTHRRGELFTLIFHLELASSCETSFRALLEEASQLRPRIWVARLSEICDWWQEKAAFVARVSETSEGLRINFNCSSRATILARGVHSGVEDGIWDNGYQRITARSLDLAADPRPFVGLAGDVPESVATFLRAQGYILDAGKLAPQCRTYLDGNVLSNLSSEVALIDYIEGSPLPLVRYWPWPDGAKSALCVTGDLDALSLVDYASRLFVC